MKVEKLVVGVIGLGMGRAHLEGAVKYGAEIGLICDLNEEKLRRRKRLCLDTISENKNSLLKLSETELVQLIKDTTKAENCIYNNEPVPEEIEIRILEKIN